MLSRRRSTSKRDAPHVPLGGCRHIVLAGIQVDSISNTTAWEESVSGARNACLALLATLIVAPMSANAALILDDRTRDSSSGFLLGCTLSVDTSPCDHRAFEPYDPFAVYDPNGPLSRGSFRSDTSGYFLGGRFLWTSNSDWVYRHQPRQGAYSGPPVSVPEPGTLALFCIAAAGLVMARRRIRARTPLM